MKTIIIYYSYSGNNKLLAEELQRRLNSDIQEVIEVKRRTPLTMILDVLFKKDIKVRRSKFLISYYDRVILIGPIWWGRIASPLREFIKRERRNINSYSFITVCGSGNNRNVENELSKILQKKPITVCELLVKDLHPVNKNNKIRYTSSYQLQKQDFQEFELKIQSFLNATRTLS